MIAKMTRVTLFILLITIILPLHSQDFLSEIQQEKNNYFLLVPFYFHQGKPEKAEALIDEFLEKYPRDPIMLTEKAVLLNQFKNKPDEALEVIKKAKVIYPTYYYLNFLHATILFTKAMGAPNRDPQLLQEAAKHLETSIQDNDQLFESFYLAGIVHSEMDKPERSNYYFNQAVKIRETLPVFLYMAYNYKKTGDLEKELDAYRNILRMDPQNQRIKKPMAEAYMKKRDLYQSYLTLLGVEESDRDAAYHSLMLELYSRFDMNERIIQTFQVLSRDDEVLKKLPLSNIYHVIYAFGSLGRLHEARYALIVAEGLYQQQKELVKDMAELTKRFLDRKEITPEHGRFTYNLYVTLHFYKSQKRYREAVELIERLSSKKKDLAISLELCDIFMKQGKNKKAEALILKLQKDHGDSSAWQNFYAYWLALRQKSLDLALEYSRATLEEDAESPAYLDTYGYILYRMKRYDEACEYFEKAYAKNPFDHEIISHLADCYKKLNRKDKIRDIYNLAIEHGVDFKRELQKKLEHVR
jgi:tetratricopeptide (TPR) repeat protein